MLRRKYKSNMSMVELKKIGYRSIVTGRTLILKIILNQLKHNRSLCCGLSFLREYTALKCERYNQIDHKWTKTSFIRGT